MIIQNYFVKALIIFTCILMLPSLAVAQRCDIDEEAIFKLRKADIGAYAIWDGLHGHDSKDQRYAAGVLQGNGHVFAVGSVDALGMPNPEMVLSEVDRRGRIVWENKRKIKGLEAVLSAVRFKDDVIVMARVLERRDRYALWVGFFNARGALRHEKVFRHRNGSLMNGSITPTHSGKSLVMVVGVADKRAGAPDFSEFYRLNSKGAVISKRAFNPGPDNGLSKIIHSDDGQYYAMGYIKNARARKTGWLLKVDDKGGIVWQRQYPRGIGADIIGADMLVDGSIVTIGNALPAREDSMKAGWAMRVDRDNGAVMWQRYFTGDLDYSAKGVMANDDGVISVLLDAKPVAGIEMEDDEDSKDFARLVTLNPRGVIFDSQAYFQGEIADAYDMILGPARERILIGASRILHRKDGAVVSVGDEKDVDVGSAQRRYSGWILAAPAVDAYDDPCKPKAPRVLE